MTQDTTPTSGAADLRATFSEMLVDLPNTEPFTLFKAGFDAALAAGQATAAQAVVPAGWKLVPVDATDEMVRATDEVNFENVDTDGTMHNVWHVMIAAAPAQPAAQQPQQGVAYAELPDALLPEPHFGEGRRLGLAFRADAYSVAQVQALFASRGKVPAQQPAPSPAPAEPDMRAVVAVAVTMLYESHPDDVLRTFTIAELAEIVRITAAMGSEQVEAIYKRAWDALADSVLEDAALWFAERDNVLHSFWVLLGEAEVHADNDNNPLLKRQVEEFYRQWNALNGTTLNPRWVSRAARKQGGA